MIIDQEHRNKLDALLSSQHHCDIATVSEDGWPQSATIAFYANENYEIIFGTWRRTRKHNNLEYNDRVSMVFGFESGHNLQYEGVATVIENTHEDVTQYLTKKPSAQSKLEDETWVWFKVSPTWLRYSDYTVGVAPQQFELTFEDERF